MASWLRARRVVGSRLLVAVLAVACGPAGTSEPEPLPELAGPPRVLLISLDTLRADALSVHGARRPTPALDALAAESVRFDSALAAAPWTIPAHASLLTAVDAHVLGSRGHYPVPPEANTLAEVLRAEGLATGAVVNTTYVGEKFGFDQGFDDFMDHPGRKDGPESTQAALEFLKRHRAQPAFFFLHLFDVHAPYDNPAPYDSLFEDEVGPDDGVIPYLRKLGHHDHMKGLEQAESVAYMRARYDAGVKRLDDFLGEFFERLHAEGLFDEMLIVVTSDHGEDFFDHEIWLGHGLFLYESEMHVPLIVKFPRSLGIAPRVVSQPVSHIDVMPTILEVLGIAPPAEIQGRSLLALARWGADAAGQEVPVFGSSPHFDYSYTVRRGRWKYIDPVLAEEHVLFKRHLRPSPEIREDLSNRMEWGPQLYDLASDPRERHNVIDDHPEIAAELTEVVRRRREDNLALKERLWGEDVSNQVRLEETEKDRLRALGYAH